MAIERKKALVILIKEIFDQLDESASILARGGNASISKLILSEMSAVLKDLDPDMQKLYFEVLPTLAAAVQPRSNPIYSDESAQLSKDIKRQFIEKIRAELALKAA